MKKTLFRILALCFLILCVLCVLTACGQTSGTQTIPEGTNQTRPKGTNELKVTTNIPEAVTVSGSGYYKYNEDIHATANIKKGYEFLGWYVNDDDCISNQTVYNGKMWNQDVELSAKVIKIPENIQSSGGHSSSNSPCTLTVESLDKNYGLVSLDNQGNQEKYVAKYKMGQTFKVLAYSNTSERFVGWYGLSGELITTNATFTMSMPYFDYTLIAVWGSMDTLWDSQKLFYNKVAEGYVVKRYKGDSTSVTIPSTFKQEPVVAIANYCFANCQSLTSITIPDSVTSIGDSAFKGCTSLTKVNVTSIEKWLLISFSNVSSNPLFYAHNMYLNDELVAEIVIPNSLTSIGQYAFDGCTSLTNITIPDSVTSIGDSAFEGCTSLTSITIPDSVTSIGYCAFCGCTRLTNITLPDSLTSIGDDVFVDCTNLTSITIPNSVTSIGYCAFEYCTNLTSIIIPASVTRIGQYAFWGCEEVKRVYYGGTINQYASLENKPSGVVYYYSESEPNWAIGTGNYWHYVDGVPTIWR